MTNGSAAGDHQRETGHHHEQRRSRSGIVVMTGEILDARDRFRGDDTPTSVPMAPVDVVELARLRTIERELQRPVLDLLVELTALRRLVKVVRPAAEKVAEHKRKGYEHIRVGAFDQVLDELGIV
jgi:hypothetical protein